MAVFKCKMCGGSLDILDGVSVATCEYCGTKQTVPKSRDEVVANLFNRANNLRLKCEFDKAEQVYEKILDIDNSDSEAHWGVVLCKYGIEYVEDPKTYSRIPTCHRTLYEAVLTDVDYLSAIENADAEQKDLYIAEAKIIDELQKNILTIVNSEEPFDVFICYKETDEDGKRTVDSAIANDIYYQLTQEGFKVFYAPITLEDKLGHEYEPYIFAALNSAKVMLVVGTKPEYFDSVWVRNEWSRFIKLTKSDRSKMIIPCYRNMDAYELPDEFAHLQAQDMGKIGFITDVIRGLKKVFDRDVQPQPMIKRTKVKKPSKIKPIIEKWKHKRKERTKYYLKFPLSALCISFFMVGLALCIYFLCKNSENLLDMDCNPSSFFILFGGLVPFLVLTRIIRNKIWAISLQSVSLAFNILLYALDVYNDIIEVLVMGAFALISQIIWFILICFAKKTNKNNSNKTNKIPFFIIGAIASGALILTFELGALNFLDYQAAKIYYSSEKYEVANRYFEFLGNYKDSSNLAKDSIYNQALHCVKTEDYESVIYLLEEEIPNYKDAEFLKNTAKYKQADKFYKNKEYNKAVEILLELDDFGESQVLLQLIKREIKNSASEKINTSNYIECTVTELYKNPRKYNGKKVCVTSWKVVSQLRSQTKAGTFYDFILCDDVSNYKDKSGVSLIRVYNYYQECIQPYNTPYIGALAFSDVIYTDISDERSMITVYGTFTYQSNTTEGDRYIGDPHVYNLDVDYYIE